MVGLDAAEYRDTEVADGSWTGFTDLAVESAVVDEFYDEGVVDLYEARTSRSTPASRWSPARSRASAGARGQADPSHPRPVRVRRPAPLREQHIALDLLTDDSVGIVSLGGRAGTGKSVLALAPRSRPSSRTAPTRR